MIQRCLSVNPNLRPGINEILWATRVGLEDWERANIDVSGRDVPANLTWPWKEEEFAIGSAVPKHWRWDTKKRRRDDSDDEDDDDDQGFKDYRPTGDTGYRRKKQGAPTAPPVDGHAVYAGSHARRKRREVSQHQDEVQEQNGGQDILPPWDGVGKGKARVP